MDFPLIKEYSFMGGVTKELPLSINGFKILEDLGRADNKIRYANVLCKECKKEFITSVYHIKKIKSCGCVKYDKLNALPKMINNFKIIKDLGTLKININSQLKRYVIAECKVCKKHYQVQPTYLKDRKHCGCMKKGVITNRYAKSHPRLSGIFRHMIGRCYNKNNQDYYLYGAKGITICKEWKDDRNKFCEWALKNGYSDDLSIDRINGKKGYSPQNCRWADKNTQGRNTSRNVLSIEKARQIRALSHIPKNELAKEFGTSSATIWLVLTNKIWRE